MFVSIALTHILDPRVVKNPQNADYHAGAIFCNSFHGKKEVLKIAVIKGMWTKAILPEVTTAAIGIVTSS